MSENLRSFILQSVTGQQGVAYHHIILLALSLKFLKKQVLKLRGKCRSRQPHSYFRPPPRGTPTSICIYLIFSETTVIGLHFCRWMYGQSISSFNFVQWPPKEASFLHQRASWPFKVVQGHPTSMILVPIESAYATSC